MGTVIGLNMTPRQRRESFIVMTMLRESVDMLKARDRDRFASTIEKEQGIYNRQLREFLDS